MELDMPTFEEIDKGSCVYAMQGRFLGLADNGSYRYAHRFMREVCIKHNTYDYLFKLYIKLDKKDQPTSFLYKPTFIHQYGREFEYSAEGYEKLKEDIVKELQWLTDLIDRFLKI